MDDIQTPDFNDENFILSVKPDPSDFTLITNSVSNRSYVVQINVSLDPALGILLNNYILTGS